MIKVCVAVDTAAAIRAGINAQGAQLMDLDVSTLSETEREWLATTVRPLTQEFSRALGATHGNAGVPTITGAMAFTDEAVRARIATCATDAAKSKAEQAAVAARRAEWEATVRADITAATIHAIATLDPTVTAKQTYTRSPHVGQLDPDSTLARHLKSTHGLGHAEVERCIRQTHGYEAWATAFTAGLAAAEAEHKVMLAETRAREEVESAARHERLKTWALTHGSDRVRLMLTLNTGDWAPVAEEEFVEATAPAGFTRAAYAEADETDPRKRPTLAELEALQAHMPLVPAGHPHLSSLALTRCTSKIDDVGDRQRWTALTLCVTTPTQRTISVARVLEP